MRRFHAAIATALAASVLAATVATAGPASARMVLASNPRTWLGLRLGRHPSQYPARAYAAGNSLTRF